MAEALPSQTNSAFATLRQFARRRGPVERCDMCSRELEPMHEHLVEPINRKLVCACQACAILFEGQTGTKYKRVPRDVRFLPDFQLSDVQWESLMIPIEMAFFFESSAQRKMIALYPSPAGPMESLLSLDTWTDIVESNPVLKEMQSDVTALLVNRVGHVRHTSPSDHYLVPIDECYKLVGLIRTHWRGLSGGSEVWREIAAFFSELKRRIRVSRRSAQMPDLQLAIEGGEVVQFAAAPIVAFKLRIRNRPADEVIHTIAMRAQIQIEVTRRKYDAGEQERLKDLFGEPQRWGQTLKSLLWTHASVVVPRFSDSVVADIPVPCTFDFNVAATKYFHGLADGDLPLCFQFSGTVFYEGEDGALQVAPISWDRESRYRLPLKTWKDLMDLYYPNSAWLSLRRDVFEKLYEYKVREGIPTWEEALERVLKALPETVQTR